jgi:hypothetical protein
MLEPEALNKISRDNRSEYPGLFERSGLHPMRHVSVIWCREHPVEAAELPGWRLELLASVLQGVT